MSQEQAKVRLFREKSLEAVESPEKLNDYLKVTSPGVWLVLSAVIALLAGFVMWGIFGKIETKINIAVEVSGDDAVCYVPFDELDAVTQSGSVIIDGKSYALSNELGGSIVIIDEHTNPFVISLGGLTYGDVTVALKLKTYPEEGVYAANVVKESLRPISLLLQ